MKISDLFTLTADVNDLPTDWGALCAIVLLLGMRHGFDADHLATIDGLTRLNQRRQLGWARYCGALYSLGHGLVVMLIATFVGLASTHWRPPAWLDLFGAWVSIAFLIGLGLVNLRAVLRAAPGEVVAPVGWKTRWLGRWTQARHPASVAGVGVLFAISFDTVSQSALFAATATQFGGLGRALTLGALFILGMLITDGLNGWWISRLIARADEVAALASRIMGAAVGSVSLLIGLLGLAKLLSPAIEAWTDGQELVLGAAVVLTLLTGYGLARWLGGRRQPA